MTRTIKRAILTVFGALLLLAGSPGKDAAAQVETGENIMDSASQFGQLQYFRTLLEETGLDEKLDGDESYTIFAPVDEAFNQIPEETMQELLEDPEALEALLLSHITKGERLASELGDMDNLTMINDVELELDQHEQGVSLEGAMLVAADIVATNGVIHAIDQVVMP